MRDNADIFNNNTKVYESYAFVVENPLGVYSARVKFLSGF